MLINLYSAANYGGGGGGAIISLFLDYFARRDEAKKEKEIFETNEAGTWGGI